MEGMQTMDDLEIQEKVESLAGKGTRVLDCEKTSSYQAEEVLLVNGYPVPLHGEEGARIKEALLTGKVPPCELLNEILIRAGILKNPVELETTMNVKSTTKTTELLTLRDKNGVLVDERMKEVEEDNEFKSTSTEVWKKEEQGEERHLQGLGKQLERITFTSSSSSPVPPSPNPRRTYSPQPSTATFSSDRSSASTSSTTSPSPSSFSSPRFSPSIFGTVASSPSPDSPYSTNHTRKTLPQTPITGNGSIPTVGSHHHNGSSSLSSASSTSSSSSDGGKNGPPSLNGALLDSTSSTDAGQSGGNDWDNALLYEDTNLVSGTLEALIKHLVPTDQYYPDRAYIFAFLLSSRLYIRPHELLGRVFRLASTTSLQHSSKNHSVKETKIVAHIVQLLGEWAELFPYDFRDERMMAHVRTITQKCVVVDPPIRKDVSQLLTSLLTRLTALERYEDYLHRINTEAALAEPLTAPSILNTCPNPTMLAQQLTHIELERLSHIGPEEFVQAFAKDNSQVETRYKDMKKTRNLESYVQWFNRLSYFVATEICKLSKKKLRVRVIEYFIETARETMAIGNFNSLMAIIAGLNMSSVARLKKTWQKVSSAQLSILEHQMDPSSNFSSYRATLKAAVWRSAGATDERQRIVIPFFSLLVKDLYFLNEGCASKLKNGQISFLKFWEMAKVTTEVLAWQQITCPFPKVQAVLNSLQTAPIFNENALCLASYECEGADNAQEKERLKYLRQEDSNSKKILQNSPNTTSKDKEVLLK